MKTLLLFFLLFPVICLGQTIKTDTNYWIYPPSDDTIMMTWQYREDTTTFKYLYVDDGGHVKMDEGFCICKTECFYDGTPLQFPYECKYFIKKDDTWIEQEFTEYQFLIPKQ
jgi:hypothetical protein